jgi:hypothetical protein
VRTVLSLASLRRSAFLLALLVLTLGLAACGHKEAHPTAADTEGQYIDVGPLTYQVQLSRQLNPYNAEDKGYLVGVGGAPLKPDEEWLAIFMWAKNETKVPHQTTNSFSIVDTQGNRYYPVTIDSSINPYAWTSTELPPLSTYPAPDTTAAFGPTQGALLLFRLPTSIYSNRPLTLEITGPGQPKPSTVSLDL